MATKKKPKAKTTSRTGTTRTVKARQAAASNFTALESNGIIVFALLAVIFFLIAVAQYL